MVAWDVDTVSAAIAFRCGRAGNLIGISGPAGMRSSSVSEVAPKAPLCHSHPATYTPNSSFFCFIIYLGEATLG